MKKRVWSNIKLPLGDKSYLQDVDVFIFSTGNGFLMIDAGLNTDESFSALIMGLKDLGYRLEGIKKLIITHYHLDHCGLALRLQKMTSVPVYLHDSDKKILEFFKKHLDGYPEKIWNFFHSYGVPDNTMDFITKELYVYKALLLGPTDTLPLQDGDRFEIEDGYIDVIATPGHTPGHVSLFYPEERILFGSDFILKDEWPHGGLYPHTKDYNPIKDYLESLKKVKAIEPKVIIPSHGEPIYEPLKRIDDAIGFMIRKIDEVYGTLKNGPLNLAQICDRVFRSYDSSLSYFFLLSLGLAYVKYLVEEGMAEEIRDNGITLFKGV